MDKDYKDRMYDWYQQAIQDGRSESALKLARAWLKLFPLLDVIDGCSSETIRENLPSEYINRIDEVYGMLDEAQADIRCIADDIAEYLANEAKDREAEEWEVYGVAA